MDEWYDPKKFYPPENGYYLVYAKTHVVPHVFGEPTEKKTMTLAYYDVLRNWWSVKDILYWHHLPLPPEEKGSEDNE